MRYLIFLLWLNAVPLAAAPRAALRLPSGLIIGSIKIETHNVFETELPSENKLLYRAANRVHFQTHDAVIMRELLFAVGDRYDADLVAETERNLRALNFIRRAEAEATVNSGGTVDIIVRTYDSWTLEIVAGYKRAGGSTSVKGGLAESNIMGRGKAGSVVYGSEWGADSMSFGYKDPQLWNFKRFQYSMAARTTPGSQNFSLALNRPFYASIAPSAVGGNISYDTSSAGGVSRRGVTGGVNYGVALKPSKELTRRVKFGLVAQRADSTGPESNKERSVGVQLGADWEKLDFLTARRIRTFTHDEEYNLGLGVFPSVVWSPAFRALGITRSQIKPGIEVRKNFTWANQLLLLKSGYSSLYAGGGNSNLLASVDAVYFLRGIRFQTLAFHAGLDLGWHLNTGTQLVLGELNGLRGYGLSRFTGNRRFLFNIEDRVYIWDDLLRLMDIGMVFFYDSGYVWPESSPIRLADLKNSVGMGLRLAPSRSSNNSPVRIDMAYALSGNQGYSRWSLSILGGQAF
ncbi:MAG: hypothetical protein A2218_01775 [Elusimicrobia bacterium RIFOXYA2_FULL_53_38]|nr:MAG: hypothetical protein A2218_01775 [Elusimicrobia bacterium RIFOXYA2_FULL_53_38]